MYDPRTEERLAALEAQALVDAEEEFDPKQPASFAGDKVGAGRYILCFLLAGLFGLWAAYWARYYGWRCVWISGVIFMVVVALFVAAEATQECYYDTYGNYRCD